jgi:hypothetical protein
VQLARDVVAALMRLLGNEALATILSKGNLPCMPETLHQHQKSALGEGHPTTLHTLRELVITTWDLRGYEAAIGRQNLLVSAAPDTTRANTRLTYEAWRDGFIPF